MFRIRNSQDFAAALMFAILGAAGLWFGRDYDRGTASSMGPGYVPAVLSWALILFGIVVGVRAVRIHGPRIERIRWRVVILILGSITAFALLIEPAGLVTTIFGVSLMAALASPDCKWKESVVLSMVLAFFCVLVFIYGLHQSMTVFGAD